MFKTANAILQAELNEAHRRERRLLDIIRDLNDRLASAHDKPWTLPPRPVDDEPDIETDADREAANFIPV